MRTRRLSLAVVAAVVVPLLSGSRAHAQLVVTDPGNTLVLIQQLLSDAEQVQNQITQIQNQVRSLQAEANMLKHLDVSNFQQAIAAMRQVQTTLLRRCAELDAEGSPDPIRFDTGLDCRTLIARFRAAYPAPSDWPAQSDQQLQQMPDQWAEQQRGAAAQAMTVQNASVASMDGTQQRMDQLASASRSAAGQTAAVQATNEMLVTLSAQLRDQQAATLALERSLALQQARDAADDQRAAEVARRADLDADTTYDVEPVPDPFSGSDDGDPSGG
jgi:conjugal transfer/entry exclusion protein